MSEGEGVSGQQNFSGNVGQVVGGNVYHIYNEKPSRRVNNDLRRNIGELLKICDPVGHRKIIEKISLLAYGKTNFKSLEVEQVRELIDIATDLAASIEKFNVERLPWWMFWRK